MRKFKKLLQYFFIISALLSYSLLPAQNKNYTVNDWIKILSETNDNNNTSISLLIDALDLQSKHVVTSTLDEIERNGDKNANYFQARLKSVKAQEISAGKYPGDLAKAKQLLTEALHHAYETGNDFVIAYVCWIYGVVMFYYQEIDLATAYLLKTAEINEGRPEKLIYYEYRVLLGELLFHIQEYRKSIYYTRGALDNWIDKSWLTRYYKMKAWNTLGQDYQQVGKPDSALYCYDQSNQIAYADNHEVWKGINAGFKGQVYVLRKEYAKAKPLLDFDFEKNQVAEKNIAGNTLQWMARLYLMQNKNDSALIKAKLSVQFLKPTDLPGIQNLNYLKKAYETTMDVYRALKNTDSFYRYSQLFTELSDSLEHILYLSNSSIAQIRINNERNRFAIKALQSEKRSIIQKRNFIIAAVSFLAIIIIIILDRQKKILRYRQQLVLKEKEKTDAEVLAAREQLDIFTQSLVEKTILLNKMQQQLSETVLSREQHKIINDLTHQTILTEDDWTKFKSLFEHIYPAFFSKLRQKAKDITLAEQRMAALTRLHLTAKEMASMLGISPDSVHKTKHRLRQRLQISTENSMDEFISGL